MAVEKEKIITVDHTGEIWHNKKITGPGDCKIWTKKNNQGKLVTIREQLWYWTCMDCGESGMTRYHHIKEPHKCRPKALAEKIMQDEDDPYLCAEQCKKCGHWREIAVGGHCCHYILDTHHMRPRVDLRSEPCPVRDKEYVPQRDAPALLPGPEAIEKLLARREED